MSAMRKPVTKIVEHEEREMSIEAIEVIPELMQARAKTDPVISRQYSLWMAGGAVFPPVVVFLTPGGRFLLADGFHRIDAADRLKRRSIRAVIRKGSMEDAILFGIEHNRSLGKLNEFKDEDSHHAAEIMILNETFRSWSDSQIGKRAGCSKDFVAKTRVRLQESKGIPIPERVMRFKGGQPTSYTVPYRRFRGEPGKSAMISADGRWKSTFYRAAIGGKSCHLGSDPDAARRLVEAHAERTARFADAVKSRKFPAWAVRNEVLAESHAGDVFGGYCVRGAVVFPFARQDMESVFGAVGRCVLYRVDHDPASRTILVGALDGGSRAGQIVSFARRLDPPIEIMSPDEFLAEFRAKGEDSNPVTPEPDQAGST